MLIIYLKIGIRNFFKHRTFSLIKVIGLALAMSVCLLIILMLADQNNYDQFHKNKDRIYRVLSDENNSKAPNAVTAYPLAGALKDNYSIVEESTHLTKGGGTVAAYNNKVAELQTYFATPSFFNVFSFELKNGDSKTALSAPNSIVITEEYAKLLFGQENPVGNTIELLNQRSSNLESGVDNDSKSCGLYTVTGILTDLKEKSHLQFDALISASSIPVLSKTGKMDEVTSNWGVTPSYTYVLLMPGKSENDLMPVLNDLTSLYYADSKTQKGFHLMEQKLTDITPGIIVRNATNNNLPMVFYYFLSLLALVIMVSAILNYTNMSIARALTRAREIGIRKAIGAGKRNLIFQFIGEATITSLVSLVIAITLLLFIKPAFKELSFIQSFNIDLYANLPVYFIFLGFAVLIGVIAGAYPAVYMSGFQPIKVLKNVVEVKTGKLGIRKVINTSQLVVSLLFITTSILIYQQFRHYLNYKYEFETENILNIPLQGNNYQIIANSISTIPGVLNISASDIIPATDTENGIQLRNINSEKEYQLFNIINADENFIDNLGIKFTAGKNFHLQEENNFLLVNESATRELGYSHPSEIIGQELDLKYGRKILKVIGVFQDFHFKNLMHDDRIGPLVLQNQPDKFRFLNVKITPTNYMEAIDQMKINWNAIDPVHPFQYEFYDNKLAANYKVLFDVVSILVFLTFISVIIACLGMLGMVAYSTERKTKEIAIRKILGAESLNLTILLSKSFLKVLLIAIVIGAPLSYFINNLWLQRLPNRVHFGFGTVLLATFLLLSLGLISIVSQTIRVSGRNPVETIREN